MRLPSPSHARRRALATAGVLVLCVALPACERAVEHPPEPRSPGMNARPPALAPDGARSADSPHVAADERLARADTLTTLVVDTSIVLPRIVRVGAGFVLHLPRAMDSALRALSPDFRPLRRGQFSRDLLDYAATSEPDAALFAALGDFDGDGRLDVAMEGDIGLVAILNRGAGASAMCVSGCAGGSGEGSGQRDTYIRVQPRGVFTMRDEDGAAVSITLATDGIHEIYFEKAAVLYRYERGVWIQTVTSD